MRNTRNVFEKKDPYRMSRKKKVCRVVHCVFLLYIYIFIYGRRRSGKETSLKK